MSLDSLKKQASRLAAYLSAKHRVNLKHASALEAIAAVHGARNWQTLSAQGQVQEVAQDESALPGSFPLSWHVDGRAHLQVSASKWAMPALAWGKNSETAGWLFSHLKMCLDRGIGGVFFDMAGESLDLPDYLFDSQRPVVLDLRTKSERELAKSDGYAFEDRPLMLPVSLFAGMSAEEVADVLITLLPGSASEAGEQPARLKAYKALVAVGEAILSTGTPVTPFGLHRALTQEASLERLRQAATGEGKTLLEGWMQSYVPEGQLTPSLAAIRNDVGGIAGRLGMLALDGEESGAFSQAARANSLPALLSSSSVLLVRLPQEKGLTVWVNLWTTLLQMIAKGYFQENVRPLGPPLVVGIPELERFASVELARLAERGRAIGMVFRFATRGSLGRMKTRHYDRIVANCLNQLHFGDKKEEIRAEMLRRFDESPAVLLTTDTCSF